MAESARSPDLPVEPELSGAWFRDQLLDRRRRLERAPGAGRRHELHALLREVDDALERLDRGSYGTCEKCHDPIEGRRLVVDPLTRICLGCLSESQRRALEHDLQLASAAQRALLPDELVRAGGWEIAHRYLPLGPVSGDYADVLLPEGDGGPAWFVLGDVSGKGLAASILMGHLQAVFRALVAADVGPAELARRANRILCEGVVASAFSTLLLGRSLPTGQVEIANAGHDPALLVQTGKVTPLPATGLPLGLFCDSGYETTRFRMEPGDTILLYTDGLTETVNGDGDAYGSGRLDDFAGRLGNGSGPEALEDWLADLDAFRGGRDRSDDLTLMVVRRRADGAGHPELPHAQGEIAV